MWSCLARYQKTESSLVCCLARVCVLEGHIYGGLDYVKTLAEQHKQLTIMFGNKEMKAKTKKK